MALSAPPQQTIDELLAASKTPSGVPEWEPEKSREGDVLRWSVPLEVGGEISGLKLQVKAYPNEPAIKFRIGLFHTAYQGRAVWRLDYANDHPHLNPVMGNTDVCGHVIRGPHYHCWSDNRQYCTSKNLPRELQYARELTRRIRRFEDGYRWFCSETHIANMDDFGIPELPIATRLLLL